MEYFYGKEWQQKVSPTPATQTYVARIQQIAREDSDLLIAHQYTRYDKPANSSLHTSLMWNLAYQTHVDGGETGSRCEDADSSGDGDAAAAAAAPDNVTCSGSGNGVDDKVHVDDDDALLHRSNHDDDDDDDAGTLATFLVVR